MGTDRFVYARGVSAGGNDRMPGGECGLGDVGAETTARSGDEPNFAAHNVAFLESRADPFGRLMFPVNPAMPVLAWPGRWVPHQGTPGGVLLASGWRSFDCMDNQDDISAFLTSRRAKLTPIEAGLPDFGGRRRVPGLRREEVALLAGMSAEYYKRLERGNASGVSEAVIDGVSRALQLDEAEHAHLYDLIRTANAGAHPQRRRPARRSQVSPALQQTIDAMSTVPVYVQNGRLDAVATNRLGRALFSEMLVDARPPANAARFVFLDPRAQTFYRD